MADNEANGSAILVNAREAAKRLGISPRFVWTLTNRGEFHRVRVGGRVLFHVSELEQFAERMLANGVVNDGG